jgi:hypothetical protein
MQSYRLIGSKWLVRLRSPPEGGSDCCQTPSIFRQGFVLGIGEKILKGAQDWDGLRSEGESDLDVGRLRQAGTGR